MSSQSDKSEKKKEIINPSSTFSHILQLWKMHADICPLCKGWEDGDTTLCLTGHCLIRELRDVLSRPVVVRDGSNWEMKSI